MSRFRSAVQWWIGALASVTLLTACLMNSGPALGASGPGPASLDPAQVAESLAYLENQYHVSPQEAMRRLELQKEAQSLDTTLARTAPDVYGGMWLDQDHGGQLVLEMTKPEAASAYLRGMRDAAHVSVRKVARSRADLTAAMDRLSRAVHAGPDAIYLPEISEVDNQVVLWKRTWVATAKQAAANSPAATAAARNTATTVVQNELDAGVHAAALEGPAATIRDLAMPHQEYTPYVDWGFCHPLYCAYYGPMRGGLRLDVQRDDGNWGGCTSGFNVRSWYGSYSGWAWILTAGHCVLSGLHWNPGNTTPLQHDGYSLFKDSGVVRNSYPYDYAILPYIDGPTAVSWLENYSGRNRVLTYCRNYGQDSDANTPCGPEATSVDKYITGIHTLGEIKAGWVVCASGSASNQVNYPEAHDSGAGYNYLPGTRCGHVTETNVGINADICARDGDSGGPLFSEIDNTAYGILEGDIQQRSGPCLPGELNDYAPISTILDDVNNHQPAVNGGSTFSVITSSNG